MNVEIRFLHEFYKNFIGKNSLYVRLTLYVYSKSYQETSYIFVYPYKGFI